MKTVLITCLPQTLPEDVIAHVASYLPPMRTPTAEIVHDITEEIKTVPLCELKTIMNQIEIDYHYNTSYIYEFVRKCWRVTATRCVCEQRWEYRPATSTRVCTYCKRRLKVVPYPLAM